MCQSIDNMFVETIRVEGGKIHNLSYHEERMNRTRRKFYGNVEELSLSGIINPVDSDEILKYRLLYAENIIKVEHSPYHIREVRTLRPVVSDTIEYAYKSTDRGKINDLFTQRGDCDDIVIVRGGKLTDTSICNIAVWDGDSWLTPATPLLAGTMRASLLDQEVIKEAELRLSDITPESPVRLFNAMIPFGRIECRITGI